MRQAYLAPPATPVQKRPLYVAPPEPALKIRKGTPFKPTKVEVDQLMQVFQAVLAEPLSQEELNILGQPAYNSAIVSLYKVFRHYARKK